MPMHAPRVEHFLDMLAGLGVEVEVIDLPRLDGSTVPTITLIRETADGHRLMVPLGSLQSGDLVAPDVVNSWCDFLEVPRIGYGAIEDD